MATLVDIINYMRQVEKPFREWEEGVARRATPQGFGEALLDNLSADPREGDYGVVGAGTIHGQKSKLFPEDWKGGKGKAWKMIDEGASPDEIARKSYDETGMMVWPQHLYDKQGQFNRTDLMMDVPSLGLKEGKYTVDDIAGLDPTNKYPIEDFGSNILTKVAYPELNKFAYANLTPDVFLHDKTGIGAPAGLKPGKYGRPNQYRVNEEAGDFEESLLPAIEHQTQLAIGEAERFAPGGSRTDPNYERLAGTNYANAAEKQYELIQELRDAGMSDKSIREYLVYEEPIYKSFATPDVMQIVNERSNFNWDNVQSGKKRKPRYGTEPKVLIQEIPVEQPALKRQKINKIRFPGKTDRQKELKRKQLQEKLSKMIYFYDK